MKEDKYQISIGTSVIRNGTSTSSETVHLNTMDTVHIDNVDKLVLHGKEIDISFCVESKNFENINKIELNGITFVREVKNDERTAD